MSSLSFSHADNNQTPAFGHVQYETNRELDICLEERVLEIRHEEGVFSLETSPPNAE